MEKQQEMNIKSASSEQLALSLSDQYEQISQCRNNILVIHQELTRRMNDKKENTDAAD